jgi:hypothetical protein
MKKVVLVMLLASVCSVAMAQLQRPMASPVGKLEQKVGLTDVKVEYSRPSKNNRVVFGDVVPFNEMWRTGANENTKFTVSDFVLFGKDTLKAGTYAIFIKPTAKSWEVVFYTDITNWGTPEEWDEKKVALRTTAAVTNMSDVVETFTISLDNLTTKSANLTFNWDKTKATLGFNVPTATKMNAAIDKVMAGPSANDYYSSAEFYYNEKKELGKALEWVSKAIEMRGESAYWVVRLKSLIQAEMGDTKGAIETAKISMAAAEKAENQAYVDMNKASIEEWSQTKKK